MDLHMQVKLLRAIQEKEIERVGGTKTIRLNVRIIAATNRNLEELMKDGKFRQDLYYRLNVIGIKIPPLRERKDDISVLVHYLVNKFSGDNVYITPSVMERLCSYNWPGNVRELQNVLEHACVMKNDNLIDDYCLPQYMRPDLIIKNNNTEEDEFNLKNKTEALEKRLMLTALEKYKNKSEAIKALGISRSTFYDKIKKYELNAEFEEYD